jgi:hypothetical protein
MRVLPYLSALIIGLALAGCSSNTTADNTPPPMPGAPAPGDPDE